MQQSKTGIGLLEQIRANADRTLLVVLALYWLTSLFMGILVTGVYLPALLVGLPAVVVPGAVIFWYRGSLAARCTIAAAAMLQAATSIATAQGAIEAHFGVFVLLGLLLAYFDWRPIVVAAGVIAVHHLGLDLLAEVGSGLVLFPSGPSLQRVLVHAAYVVAEAGMLAYLAWRIELAMQASDEMGQFASRAGTGDLTGQFSPGLLARSPMLHAASTMKQHMVHMIGTVKKSSDTLLTVCADLSTEAASLSEGTNAQVSERHLISGALTQVGHSISAIELNAHSAVELINESLSLATQGKADTVGAGKEMTQVNAAILNANQSLDELRDKADRAMTVVAVIKEITDQTNLLALNAAIEAARAGESGRGFAVVADEVRKLAHKTSEATDTIAATMGDMAHSKDAAINAVNGAALSVERSLSQTLHAGENITHMVELIQRVSNAVSEITTALGEQNTASTDVTARVNRNNTHAERAHNVLAEMAERIELLRQLSADFQRTGQQFQV